MSMNPIRIYLTVSSVIPCLFLTFLGCRRGYGRSEYKAGVARLEITSERPDSYGLLWARE